MIKEYAEVYVYDEYYDESPTHAIIGITDEDLNEIFKLRQALEDAKADKISKYDCTPMMVSVDDETEEETESDCRIDCMMLNVYKTRINWSFLIKNTNINGEVESIYFEQLEEYIKVREMPLDELPTLINEEFKLESTKKLFQERLNVLACA